MADLSTSLIGLSLLSGGDAFSAFGASVGSATPIESRAQRTAKAAFTTPVTTPPWKSTAKPAADSVQLAAIRSMKTIIDKPDPTASGDVQTTLTAYKALDRLKLLAKTASLGTTSSVDRANLQKVFAKGLADLKTYLAAAPSNQVDLSFASSSRQAQSVAIASPSSLSVATIAGEGVSATRAAPLAGLTGTEKFRIDLSATGRSDSVTVDLSTGAQPPTLDSVADQINAAIKSVPRTDGNGQPVLDDNGATVPRWAVTASASKTGDSWGLSFDRAGFETISLDQIGGGDAILVANGVTTTDALTSALISRFDDPTGAATRQTLNSFTAVDGDATDRLKVAADADATKKTKAVTVNAATGVRAVATDAQGFSYVVGTTAGDLGSNLSHGSDDLYLTKLDSEGNTVWQRTLGGAGTAQGAAITIAPDGGIVVAGTVTGSFDGATSDGDMLVAKYDATGEEKFSTLARSIGGDTATATAVAVGADGSIYVGGSTSSNGGDAVISLVDPTGKLTDRRVFGNGGSDSVKALAIGADGNLLALTGESGRATLRQIKATSLATDIKSLDLGAADARAIAVAADGTIAVAGATGAALGGVQTNTPAGGRDGFVARIDAGLSGAAVTYLGTGSDDQADSVAFLGGSIYVGGRTNGALDGQKTGATDAFVARIDAASGTIADINQFGKIGATSEAVQISAIKGGDSALGALGLHRGTLTPTDSVSLEAQTSLRVGDFFSVRANNGAIRKVTVADGDTLTTLSTKLRSVIGSAVATVSTPSSGTGRSLRIDMKPGNEIELIAGSVGSDALAKLGLDARRIASPAPVATNAPSVRPGGSFALDLTESLRIDTKTDAATALARVTQAVSYSQSAYRSLYWDDTKAALVDTPAGSSRKGGSTAVQQAQLANYQAALTRLTSGSSSSIGF